MDSVSVRELRNHGGDVLDRVLRGETLVVTKDGTAVAELRPLPGRSLAVDELVRRRRDLPMIDLDALRTDLDRAIDPEL